MSYINKKGKKKEPIMLHRALLGALERFIGLLIEHYGGAFPLWLSPVQIWIVPIAKRHKTYAKKIEQELKAKNFRVELKDENETVSKKIRNAELQKIPYVLVAGDKELKSKKVRLRTRGKGDIGPTTLSSFIKKIKQEVEKKR